MARYTTDEAAPGESWSLEEMLEANVDDEWLRDALPLLEVGDSLRDIVTVTRVS